jgi:hypothetical protein
MIEIKRVRRLFFLLKTFKIPLIGYTGCKIVDLNEQACSVMIKLKRRTKNHLNSMYFGSLSVGADVAAGMLVFYHFELEKATPHFSFKSMNGQFFKRAESDVVFTCTDGLKTKDLVLKAKSTGERQEQVLIVDAHNTQQELVAQFEMLVSVKLLPK